MEDKLKELKTYIASEPFCTIVNENMRQTVEYYAAFAYPMLFIRQKTEHWDDGSSSKLNVYLDELVECFSKEFLMKFIRAIPRLFMDIAEGTAITEDYDAVAVLLKLTVDKIGGIDKLKVEHVLEFLRDDP